MLFDVELTERQARLIEDALLAYGAKQSDFIKAEIVETIRTIKQAKAEKR